MRGDLCKRTRSKPDRKPSDQCADLRGTPSFALGFERALRQSVVLADIRHNRLESRSLGMVLRLGQNPFQEVFFTDHSVIGLSAVERRRMSFGAAGIDEDGKAPSSGICSVAELAKDPVRGEPRQVLLAQIGLVAAPDVGNWISDDPGTDRIEVQIPDQRQSIAILIHQECLEASLKYMPDPVEPGIQVTGVAKREALHADRQARFAGLER